MINLNGIHIFIVLFVLLIFSSCLGMFTREGYDNSNLNGSNDGSGSSSSSSLTGSSSSNSDKSKNKQYSSYDDMYHTLDHQTIDYSDSQLAKNKKIGPHHPHDDNHDDDDNDNDSNNINSYGNINKYPNVDSDHMLMAGHKMKHHKSNNSNLPPGNEDLYILKSSIVPPVCPACPTVTSCPSTKDKCPPCPPCARCPEPAFECKKVPNYSGQNDSYLPQPIMSDFSQFGL